MITTFLKGGLGNMLFQISAAASLAHEHNDIAVFSTKNAYCNHKSIETYQNNILRNIKFQQETILTTNIYNEPVFEYRSIPYNKNLTLYGYFQSEKYFNKQLVLDLFDISENIKKHIYLNHNQIFKNNTCSIHVRRGDYLLLSHNHTIRTMDYYNEAIKQIPKNTKFLIFSDDMLWCKQNFIGEQYVFIENQEDYMDLYMMSQCDYNIIANSSFSWWGAWLNQNPEKIVIAPKQWFGTALQHYNIKDLIPTTWKQI